MKKLLLVLTVVALTSCQKEENFKPCGSSPIDGNDTWTKKGKCYKSLKRKPANFSCRMNFWHDSCNR